ncbi:MAG: hypothetical protein EP335_15710 [Alphaproteobacteria bacterium]|nr:MAG: hypothetical protein EP335_15710 [Alphaproteobacteria bacterium]
MRILILVAATGMLVGFNSSLPGLQPAANAQTLTAEQTLQAQISALARAGDTAGLSALIDREVTAGRADMLANIAESLADMGLTIAGADPDGATAFELAAIQITGNATVRSRKPGLIATVGRAAGQVQARLASSSPANAALIAGAVAGANLSDLSLAYNQGVTAYASTNQSTGSTAGAGNTSRNTGSTSGSETPVIVLENPDQASPT